MILDQPLTIASYPRAIVHIDGDAFFAACEQARNPKLQGRPVVTGKERGIAASMSYEAKARGVVRGMRLADIRRVCPEAIILPSDYETYSLLSKRLFAIVRRYTPDVEEYSIDECFADLTGLRRPLRLSYERMACAIKAFLEKRRNFGRSRDLPGGRSGRQPWCAQASPTPLRPLITAGKRASTRSTESSARTSSSRPAT